MNRLEKLKKILLTQFDQVEEIDTVEIVPIPVEDAEEVKKEDGTDDIKEEDVAVKAEDAMEAEILVKVERAEISGPGLRVRLDQHFADIALSDLVSRYSLHYFLISSDVAYHRVYIQDMNLYCRECSPSLN